MRELPVPSKILEVSELENSNWVWKRILQGLPAGQMFFLLRASMDTLSTPLNLRRWKLRADPSCPLCRYEQPTILLIPSNCPIAFEQGRYTWYHDSALFNVVKSIKRHLDSDTTLYADLPGMRVNENPPSTIPDEILVTSFCLDIILIDKNRVKLIELTVSHNSLEHLSNARLCKSKKETYLQVLNDLEVKGITSQSHTIEIGSLGHWLPSSLKILLVAAPSFTKTAARKSMDEAARRVIRASQVIFNAQLEKICIYHSDNLFALAKIMLSCHATLSSGVIFLCYISSANNKYLLVKIKNSGILLV